MANPLEFPADHTVTSSIISLKHNRIRNYISTSNEEDGLPVIASQVNRKIGTKTDEACKEYCMHTEHIAILRSIQHKWSFHLYMQVG